MAFTSGTPTGQISMSQVEAEFPNFAGNSNLRMSNYYNCAYQVPTSGQISMSQLRGKYRYWGGIRFIRRTQSVNTYNDRVERNGTGYGWRLRTYNSSGLSANPGTDGAAIRGDGTHRILGRRSVIVEKVFFYYYARRWRVYIQVYDYSSPYSYNIRDAVPSAYELGIRISVNNNQYTNYLTFGNRVGPSGYLNNPYKIVTGDVSRRRVYAWIWQGGFTLSNYFDFQFMTLRQ